MNNMENRDLEKMTTIFEQLSDTGRLLLLASGNALYMQQQMMENTQQKNRELPKESI